MQQRLRYNIFHSQSLSVVIVGQWHVRHRRSRQGSHRCSGRVVGLRHRRPRVVVPPVGRCGVFSPVVNAISPCCPEIFSHMFDGMVVGRRRMLGVASEECNGIADVASDYDVCVHELTEYLAIAETHLIS